MQDTSTLLAAVANANSLTAYPLVLPIQTSNWSLERLAQVLLGGGDALRGGPGVGLEDGNSGNRAAVSVVLRHVRMMMVVDVLLICHIPWGFVSERSRSNVSQLVRPFFRLLFD